MNKVYLQIEDKTYKIDKPVLNKINDMCKENERLNKENNDLRKLYQRTYNHLFEIGNDELARYFQAQIDECPTFYAEPIIDYHEETKRLTNIIDELEKELKDRIKNVPDTMAEVYEDKSILHKLQELKGSDKE